MELSAFTVLQFLCIGQCWSANILAFLPSYSPTYDAFQPLFKELAVRGHNVTVVSPFTIDDPPQNYHHIDVSVNESVDDLIMAPTGKYLFPLIIPFVNLFYLPRTIMRTLNNTKITEFIYSNDYRFDVVLIDNFHQHCFLTMGHKFGAHIIQLFPVMPVAYFAQYHSQPINPSFILDPNSGYTERMSFITRTTNCIVTFVQLILFQIFYMPKQNEIMYKYFNYTGWESRPSLEEITKNISLTLINAHFTIGSTRPLVPNFIEVAGMHLNPVLKLPKDLQELMDNSTDGIVYFSFGSEVKDTQLPENVLKMFVHQLGQIEQKVLWNWESNYVPKLPPNIIVVNSDVRHTDILSHPNCVLFINHGGGMRSTEKALYYGVPMLAISVAGGDQSYNSVMMESRGAAIRIKCTELTETIFAVNLFKMLNDKTFKENSVKLSKIFRDQPIEPLDKAIYWVEYVIRNNGAHHLKTAGDQLNWFQYLLIDVIIVLFICTMVFFIILFYITDKMYRTYIKYKESNTETDNDNDKKDK